MSAGCACKDCEKRHVGCHSECEAYLAYRAKIDETAQARRAEKDAKQDYSAMRRELAYKMWRRGRHKGT